MVGQHNYILKKLAGTSWGCSKEVLLTTYKAVGCSIINYAAPIWTPTLSDSRCKDLQRKQNAVLRTIIGCHVMASELRLHHEAKIMPVKQHNAMLSTQFLLGTHKDERPDHLTIQPPDGDTKPSGRRSVTNSRPTWPTSPLWRTWTSATTKKASPTSTSPSRLRRKARTP